jgi:cytochrome c
MCFSPGHREPSDREPNPRDPGTAWQKHCTLTAHVKAANFASLFFYPYPAPLRTVCVAMQRDPPRGEKNNAATLPGMLLRQDPDRGCPDPPIHTGKETNRKEYEMRGAIIAVVLAMTAITGARAQDAASGEKVFAVCRACHQIGETAKNGVGPVLNGIIGRPAGTYPGYSYSDANKNSGLTWDEATFRDYIKDPRAKIPGTKMIYPGLKDEQKTTDLLAFLKQFDADGKKK